MFHSHSFLSLSWAGIWPWLDRALYQIPICSIRILTLPGIGFKSNFYSCFSAASQHCCAAIASGSLPGFPTITFSRCCHAIQRSHRLHVCRHCSIHPAGSPSLPGAIVSLTEIGLPLHHTQTNLHMVLSFVQFLNTFFTFVNSLRFYERIYGVFVLKHLLFQLVFLCSKTFSVFNNQFTVFTVYEICYVCYRSYFLPLVIYIPRL